MLYFVVNNQPSNLVVVDVFARVNQGQRRQYIQYLRCNASLKQIFEISGRYISAIEAHCYQSHLSLFGNKMLHNLMRDVAPDFCTF